MVYFLTHFHAVVKERCAVARAARDRSEPIALEAGQAGFAICVGVTVALAHVAFSSAAPMPTVSTGSECQRAVVPTADSVAGAARHCLGAAALEAGQAGFAICVAVTVALAHVAFLIETPITLIILKNTFRELWLRAVVPTADSVAGAARDRLEAMAMEAGQAGFAFCVVVTVALAHVASASATPIGTVSTGSECQRAVVPTADSVAGAARHCLEAMAMEAGQAGFAICVAVTVALAHVAFLIETPITLIILKNTFRELWLRAVVPTADSVAGAARDRLEAMAMEAGQAGFAFCVVVTVALAHVASASATPIG